MRQTEGLEFLAFFIETVGSLPGAAYLEAGVLAGVICLGSILIMTIRELRN